MSSTFRLVFVSMLLLGGFGIWMPGAVFAVDAGTKVHATKESSSGRQITLEVATPKVDLVQERDGQIYSKLKVAGAGTENEEGLPALPVLVHTEEIPWNAEAHVSVQEQKSATLNLKNWIYPHQPPAPKSKTLREFVINRAYYEGKAETGLLKAKGSTGPEVMTYKKAGHSYVDIRMRPFAYDPVKGTLTYPQQLNVTLTWTIPSDPATKSRTHAVTVKITVADDQAVQALIDEGYDIVTRHGNVVTLSVTPEELAALQAKGYSVQILNLSKATADPKGTAAYHTYATVTTTLEELAATYPNLCRLVSLGKSVNNRDIWALEITDNPDVDEDEPEIKYAATIHGNESLGTEMCLYFADYLLANYATVTRAANLVNNTEIWIVPLINPDGLESGIRYNANGVDLNRGFPEGSDSAMRNILSNPTLDTTGREPEVVALMEWGAAHRFSVAANFHTGALVVNYPFDNDGLGVVDSPTPDDTVFESISTTYAQSNNPMYSSTEFTNGITNGADWYTLTGGMQDWFYRYLGCDEVTIELYDLDNGSYLPSADQLSTYWTYNQESMLAYAETALTGLRGLVTDTTTGDPVSAAVYLTGNYHPVFTDPDLGDYHRLVLPGTYDVTVVADGYLPQTVQNVVVASGSAKQLNVQLVPGTPKTGSVLIVSGSSLATGAEALRAEKEAESFETHALTASTATTTSIRHAIASAYRAHPVDYVILVGDIDTLPAFQASDGTYSDLLYRLLDDGETFSNYAGTDVMLGRVSVTSNAYLTNYVSKLAAFTAAEKHSNFTWISHGYNASDYTIAEGSHNWVIANVLPSGITNTKYYQAQGTASSIISHINAGTDAVVYSGHGDWDMWVGYDFDTTKVAQLANTLDVPLVFGHCCQSGAFNYSVCFAESWLYTTARGISYVGASNDTYWDEDDTMERQEFKAFYDTPSLYLADAVDYAQAQIRATSASRSQYYATVYHIFGDPTVNIYGGGEVGIITSSLATAYPGEAYSATLSASGGTPPYTWSLMSGTLPAGLSFNAATATLSGTPTTVGTSTLTFKVTDAEAATDTAQLTLTVANEFQITTGETLPGGEVGVAYSTTLAASGGTQPATWALASSGAYEEMATTTTWDSTGTAKNWNDDENVWRLALPFSFPFYGTSYSAIYVGSNGYIDFASSGSDWDHSDSALTDARRIAVFWTDLTTSGSGNNIYVSSSSSCVSIRWEATLYQSTNQVSFEALLYPSGRIEFVYGEGVSGKSATIGVSAGNGDDYTLSSWNALTTISEDTATRFSYIAGLPSGLSLSTAGVISGTPLASGEYTFLVTATDAGSTAQQDSRAFTITVTGDNGSGTSCSMQGAGTSTSLTGDAFLVLGVMGLLWGWGRMTRKHLLLPVPITRKINRSR